MNKVTIIQKNISNGEIPPKSKFTLIDTKIIDPKIIITGNKNTSSKSYLVKCLNFELCLPSTFSSQKQKKVPENVP